MNSHSKKDKLKFLIISSNINSYPGIFGCPLILKSLDQKIWDFDLINLYNFGIGVHKKIDEKPYGGGNGLIIMPEVIESVMNFIEKKYFDYNIRYYCTDPSGVIFDQKICLDMNDFLHSKNCEEVEVKKNLICFLCPRFEGLDSRIFEFYNFTKISIGKFIVTNGDLVVSLIVNAILRNFDGILGNQNSLFNESFVDEKYKIEYDQYTKPRIWREKNVPEILLSGNHGLIEKWQKENSLEKTKIFEKNNNIQN